MSLSIIFTTIFFLQQYLVVYWIAVIGIAYAVTTRSVMMGGEPVELVNNAPGKISEGCASRRSPPRISRSPALSGGATRTLDELR
jgi:hypothetical protein